MKIIKCMKPDALIFLLQSKQQIIWNAERYAEGVY